MSKKILTVLADGFEETEALAAVDFWRRCGFQVSLAALSGDGATGAHDIVVLADCRLEDVEARDFDAVTLPGGMPGALHLYNSEEVHAIVTETAARGAVVGAICAAPMVLARAGLLHSGRFTMFPSEELRKQYFGELRPTSELAVRDRNIVTGIGVGGVFAYARMVAEALDEADAAERTWRAMLLPGSGL